MLAIVLAGQTITDCKRWLIVKPLIVVLFLGGELLRERLFM